MKFSTSACLLFTLILLQVSVIVTGQIPGIGDVIGGGETESSAGGSEPSPSASQGGDQQPTNSDQGGAQPTGSPAEPAQSSAGGGDTAPSSNNGNSDQAQPTQSQGNNNNNDNPQATPTSSTGETPNNNNNGNGNNNNNNNNGSGSNNNNDGTGTNNNNNNNDGSSTSGGSQPNSNGGQGDSDNTATIAGSVVGGVVGIALIGGIIMWLSRRGGCTKRTGRGRDGFQQHHQPDDFMDMSDASYAAAPVVATTQMNQQQARPFIPPTSNGGYTDLNSGVAYNDTPYTYSDHPTPQQQEYYPYVQPQDPGYMAAAAATAPPMAAAAMAPDTTIPIGSKPDEVEVQHKPNAA